MIDGGVLEISSTPSPLNRGDEEVRLLSEGKHSDFRRISIQYATRVPSIYERKTVAGQIGRDGGKLGSAGKIRPSGSTNAKSIIHRRRGRRGGGRRGGEEGERDFYGLVRPCTYARPLIFPSSLPSLRKGERRREKAKGLSARRTEEWWRGGCGQRVVRRNEA